MLSFKHNKQTSKNVADTTFKAPFILKVFELLPRLFGRKTEVDSKFMTSQTGKQIITIHVLPDISRSKSSQAMKFGQLIE